MFCQIIQLNSQRDGLDHCASCDGEFLEIVSLSPSIGHEAVTDYQLDDEINPDQYQELPPPPPVRPGASPRGSSNSGGSVVGHILQGLFGGGGGGGPSQGQHDDDFPGPGLRTDSPIGQPPQGRRREEVTPRSFPGGRTFEWNIGGGHGSITFGSFGGSNMGPFGPTGGGGEDNRGLEE